MTWLVAKVLILLFSLALLVAVAFFYHLTVEIQKRFSSRRWSVPSRVFSAVVPVYPGQSLSLSDVRRLFEERRYQTAIRDTLNPGEFRVFPNSLVVHIRGFQFPGRTLPAQTVRFDFQQNKISRIVSAGGDIPVLELEPMELARLFGPERESRLLVNIGQVPRHLTEAIVAIEDHRFYEHGGLDWRGMFRALWADLRARRVVQGGSTITQQLVKNYFLEPERSIKRKLLEASMSLVMENLYTKDEILEMYLNEIYMGQRGSVAVHGVGEASRTYFGRNVEDLTLAESATLAGMIRAPNMYSPLSRPEASKKRRNLVLKRMLELEKISFLDHEKTRLEPVRVADPSLPVNLAPYFVDTVRQQLQELYAPEALESEGLNIYTTLHPELALAAENTLREGLKELEKAASTPPGSEPFPPLQAVLIAIQPKTGSVLSLRGGRDYWESSYNRALYAHRQPGSAIKPFVYLAALDAFTPSDLLADEATSYPVDGTFWVPKNYDRRYRGRVLFRDALEQSLNAATVSLALTVGLNNIMETIRTLGIQTPLQPVPSLALGAFEVTPLQLAEAYATLDNDGQKPYLLTLREVVDDKGNVLERRSVDLATVTTPAKAFLITDLLQGVVERGTARNVRRLGVNFPCAGKTGTTNDTRDSWFVGYTTDLLVLIWVGYDDNRPTELTGAKGAGRLWARFMSQVRPWIHPQKFRVPPGVVQRLICPQSGRLAVLSCPGRRFEYFLSENVPQDFCWLHSRP
ncbi:MAG TPA: PBP1A family penicillin-binding protein [Syntrophobacteraceae bacterium]|nr:PBP1A family penicillin-binding protein [Syntrophobacteraceae bacterium]